MCVFRMPQINGQSSYSIHSPPILSVLCVIYISRLLAVLLWQCYWCVVIIIIIEKHTSEGAKEQRQHTQSYMVEAEDTIKSNSD